MKAYYPHPEADAKRKAIVQLIETVMAAKGEAPLPYYKRKLLDTLLWKYTEADGKYNTRHRSVAANGCTSNDGLRHDHVFTRKELIDQLMGAKSAQIPKILENAVGCVVTNDEHTKLSGSDKTLSGWERYRHAKIEYMC
jgi:hypothetical protein